MRGRSIKNLDEANVDLTPMLDIVFILLIFFIVTSTFLQEDAIGLEPPPPACEACSKPVTPAILVFVDAKNHIRIDGSLADISSDPVQY
jgi:biopolymer transport protein ExbD